MDEIVFVDKQQVDMFLMSNQKYFPAEKLVFLKEKLYKTDETKFALIANMKFKNPTTILLLSIFLGCLGIDRFMLKETGMGILKLLTGGCCGVLTVIDWFTVHSKAQEKNFSELMLLL